jgi:protein SCO1
VVALLGLVVLVLALLSGGGSGSSPAGGGSAGAFDGAALPSPLRIAPDFTLRDQRGETVSLDSLRGRPVVLAFLYPACGASCVLIAEQIRGALDDLSHPVAVVIVNAGPSPAPPAAVARFLEQVSLSGRALYLDGTPRQLQAVWREYRVVPAGAGPTAFAQAAEVRLLDAEGRERVVYGIEQLTPDGLAHDIRILQAEGPQGG